MFKVFICFGRIQNHVISIFGVHMGFGIEGDITKTYNTYVQKHPECSVLSPDAVYLRMKEEGVIIVVYAIVALNSNHLEFLFG